MNVRIDSISIKNWKNVREGHVNVSCSNDLFHLKPSLLGIYGQNGSGKTTLIQVIEVIKTLIKGQSLSSKLVDLVSIGEKQCEIEVCFSITDNVDEIYRVKYNVELHVEERNMLNTNMIVNGQKVSVKKLVIYREKLSASYQSHNKKMRMTEIINMDQFQKDVFTPITKLRVLAGNSKEAMEDLLFYKKMCAEAPQSFIFNSNTLKVFRKYCQEELYITILENLVNYANFHLFVISHREDDILNLVVPSQIKMNNQQIHQIFKTVSIEVNRITLIPLDIYEVVKQSIKQINIVLEQLIPNLQIHIQSEGSEINSHGKEMVRVKLFSIRKNIMIPFENEAGGIKKIISILQLLITMFNYPSVTVVIDELDLGIFEYIFGEVLRIMSYHAKGQLIYTAHNLRSLETIDSHFITFTTTNPYNRYMRMKNLYHNNLRDSYYRSIVLGGNQEEFYNFISNAEIAFAFKEAKIYE